MVWTGDDLSVNQLFGLQKLEKFHGQRSNKNISKVFKKKKKNYITDSNVQFPNRKKKHLKEN